MSILKKTAARTFVQRTLSSTQLSLIAAAAVVGTSTTTLADVVELEEIIVVAHPLAAGGLAQASTVLSGENLDEVKGASIGATLEREPGIQSSSFGSAVGRPVIHGLGATRVKITQDQIDTLDVSVTSSDHAVTVESFIAERISVLKGPSTLLYGSGAIGGVVDVDTGRHKTEVPEETSGRAEVRFADVDSSVTAAARLDGRINDSMAWHLDGFTRDADDYEIPGFAESSFLRAMEGHDEHHDEDEHDEHHDEDEHEGEEEAFGILEGSRNKSQGVSFGLSNVGERHHVSASFGFIDSNYGLLGGHSHDHDDEHEEGHDEDHAHDEDDHLEEIEEEGVAMIDMQQTRFDLRAGYQFDGSIIQKLDVLFAQNDYEHSEIEGSGEVGTRFDNQAWEGRIELQHDPILEFEGIFGVQLNDRDFSAVGEEAFIAPVNVESQAVFWLGERAVGPGTVETGIRFETVDTTPIENAALLARSFDTTSASLGYVYENGSGTTLSTLVDYSGRAPSIEELYSNGAHLATQSYDIGNTDLREETAMSFSVTGNWEWDSLRINATAYYTDFQDFIYQAASGEELDELPVFSYRQDDATFYGLDLSAEIELGVVAGGDLSASTFVDFVTADVDTNAGSENLPRIPADRLGMGLRWSDEAWTLTANYLHVDAQNSVADFELTTQGYEDLSIGVSRYMTLNNYEFQFFLNGRNLTDDEQRHHASFVKDIAPAPGRSLEAGVRLSF